MHSPKFDTVKMYYDTGRWTAEMVRNAAKATPPWITEDEVGEILGEQHQSNSLK